MLTHIVNISAPPPPPPSFLMGGCHSCVCIQDFSEHFSGMEILHSQRQKEKAYTIKCTHMLYKQKVWMFSCTDNWSWHRYQFSAVSCVCVCAHKTYWDTGKHIHTHTVILTCMDTVTHIHGCMHAISPYTHTRATQRYTRLNQNVKVNIVTLTQLTRHKV